MIIFSERAFKCLKYELLSFPSKETGGIFLGIHKDSIWSILETVFPGPNAQHKSASFQCDYEYINYQVNKLANIYDQELRILGLWHSHITSSPFSMQDIETNCSFATLNDFGAISMLIDSEKKDYTLYIITQSGEYNKESNVIIKDKEEYQLCNSKDILFSIL